MTNTLHDLLTHCIAEATNELGPKELRASEIYADMARRILAVALDSDAEQYENGEQIITVRLKDVQAWLVEAYQAGKLGGSVDVSWCLTDVGWKPSLERQP